ncbi:MAG TPA: tetratricopeptide repeat protein [bacterium]
MWTRVALGFTLLMTVTVLSLFAAGGGGGGGDAEEDWSNKPKIFREGYEAIEKKDFQKAIELFKQAFAQNPKDADAVNYLGYAHRKLGDYDSAIKFYTQALELDPKHLGAHEYLGEAYLEMNNLPKAKEHLAKLDDICWLGCKEYRELKEAVRDYEKKAKS